MSFGKNLQYLRQLSAGLTQETLAEKLNVSRQTISKWEMDAANPEMDKAIELCKVFNCSLDNLFREEMDQRSSAYTNLRVEEVPGFRYVEHTVISTEPESDALDRVSRYAKENGIDHPSVIGWILPGCPWSRFVTIPRAYHTLGDYMRTNGLVYVENEVIPCFETDGEGMDVFMACR